MVLISLPTYPAKNFLIESPLVYFLVCVLTKITILVEISSWAGRRELPIITPKRVPAVGLPSVVASTGTENLRNLTQKSQQDLNLLREEKAAAVSIQLTGDVGNGGCARKG